MRNTLLVPSPGALPHRYLRPDCLEIAFIGQGNFPETLFLKFDNEDQVLKPPSQKIRL